MITLLLPQLQVAPAQPAIDWNTLLSQYGVWGVLLINFVLVLLNRQRTQDVADQTRAETARLQAENEARLSSTITKIATQQQQENRILEGKLEAERKERERLQDQIRETVEREQATRNELIELQRQLAELKVNWETTLSELSSEVELRKQALEERNKLEDRVKELEAENTRLQAEIKQLNQQIETLNRQLEEKKHETPHIPVVDLHVPTDGKSGNGTGDDTNPSTD